MRLAYLVCANGSLRRRALRTAGATVLLAAVSLVWIVAVDLVPRDQRPYVGGTMNDSELTLTFGYNGFGRVAGEVGGSGTSFSSGILGNSAAHPAPDTNSVTGQRIHALQCKAIGGPAGATGETGTGIAPGTPQTEEGILEGSHCVTVVYSVFPGSSAAGGGSSGGTATAPAAPVVLRHYSPVALGPPPGPLRLFGTGFGDQARGCCRSRSSASSRSCSCFCAARGAIGASRCSVFGGWFVVEAVVLSFSDGIVHPYYTSALAPGTAIVAACGAWAFLSLARKDKRFLLLGALAIASTVAVQIVLLSKQYDYLEWLWPVLGVAAMVCIVLAWLRPRHMAAAIAAAFVALLVVPTLYSKTVWEVPVDGTFPAAGPYTDAGQGGVGASAPTLPLLAKLFGYVDPRAPHDRWTILTQASITAAPMILLGQRAAAIGGYGTQTPGVSPAELARYVSRGEARFMLMGGAYTWRGGNAASTAIKTACPLVAPQKWRVPVAVGSPPHVYQLYPIGGQNYALYDCKGDAAALARD